MTHRILATVLTLLFFSGCAHMTTAQRKAYKDQQITKWVEKGDKAKANEEYILAEYCYRRALNFDDFDPKAVNALGLLFVETGKHLKEGERYVVRTLKRKPAEQAELYNTLTLLYTKQKKKKKAIQAAGMAEWAQLSTPPQDKTAAMP